MRKLFLIGFVLFAISLRGQEAIDYQKPPKEILELADFQRAPFVMMDEQKTNMVFIYMDAYKSIEEVSEKELRLAGLRINPKTNIGSRTRYYNKLGLRNLKNDKGEIQVKGLPQNARLSNLQWSPDQTKLAFTNTVSNGVEVWVLDVEKAEAKKLTEANVNANLSDALNWFEDGNSILVKMMPGQRKELIDGNDAVPTGPTISVNDGQKAQNRTYQDLLKNKTDEFNFELLATSELWKVSLKGEKELWLGPAMYRNINFSPDGNYVMITTVEKPFSYIVPYYRFPTSVDIYNAAGKQVVNFAKVPLIEELPKGFGAVHKGKRNFTWRNDKPSTLVYVEALDEGDPANEVPFRDEAFQIDPPFNGKSKPLLKTVNRFGGIEWANDHLAVAYDYWVKNRNSKTYLFNPSDNTQPSNVLFDRNYQDRYNDPGDFERKRNEMGSYVLVLKEDHLFLAGKGYTEQGQFPFLDQLDFKSGDKKRIYQSEFKDKLEDIRSFDPETNQVLVRIESKNEYPNYYFRDLSTGNLNQLTSFENPFKGIEGVKKEVISYKREDGVDLTATLYLPLNYQAGDKHPMILWAYPLEYKDQATAGQNTQNPNDFTYPYYGSPIYWVTRGYVVLDDAAFPIIGEGETEPNDSFRSQLVANAKAAIDAVDKMGYIDRNKVAVGGHSYGAFMVANLLSHSNLFAAGIARSGAYNRTLTPFGFQGEERHYWDAPEVYYDMSPFMHAEKMKTPLLLVHGAADNNSGTYTMQSERYFNALKGLGATVRLVILPKESHGYAAKESVLHLLWEQDQWLEKYVKNRPASK